MATEEVMHQAEVITAEMPKTEISEESFPKPSSRMQELMNKFSGEAGNLPASSNQIKELTKPTTKLKTRTFEDLTPEEQKKVYQLVSSVDYMTSKDIMEFGGIKESLLTQNAERIIGKYNAKDVDVLANPMTDLLSMIKSDSFLEEIAKAEQPDKKWTALSSFFEMFSLKKAKRKLAKKLAEMQPLLKSIGEIEVYAKNQSKDLESDIEVYEQMTRDTIVQLNDFELCHIALGLMIEDATQKLSVLEAKDVLDLNETYQMNELRSAIERMQRRQYSLYTIKVSTFQSIPQLGVLVRGDEIIVEKIGEIIYLVLPMWKWQYAIAIGAIRQKEALTFQKLVRGITSQLVTGNAKLLHDNMIAAQEELHATAIAVQDLVTVQEYIDDMLVKVKEARQQASKEAVEGMKTMEAIEQKNREMLLNSGKA